MTNWIEWNGGECPIKSDKTRVEIKYSDGRTAGAGLRNAWRWSWVNNGRGGDIIAYRIVEDHEPKEPVAHTREEIMAQIEALQKQLDAMPVPSRVTWGPSGEYRFTHEERAEVINGVPHIHGIAMKKLED